MSHPQSPLIGLKCPHGPWCKKIVTFKLASLLSPTMYTHFILDVNVEHVQLSVIYALLPNLN